LNAPAGTDIFVAKLSPLRNWSWAVSGGGAGDEWPTSIILDSSNKVTVAGFTNNTTSLGANIFSVSGANDSFVAKVNNNGVWDRKIPNISGNATVTVTKGSDTSSYSLNIATK
jgi:hypothetical protein